MNIILGINFGHPDSSACLVIEGDLIGAVSEERFGERIKNTSNFPSESVKWLLQSNNINLKDITHVAIGRNPQSNLIAKVKYVLSNPNNSYKAVYEHFKRRKKTFLLKEKLAELFDIDAKECSFQIVGVEQHLAHLASSYYLSPFDSKTSGISYDASGDFASFMAAKCEGTKITIIDRVILPHSLGFFYTAMCQFIGFDNFGEEYKVMGLAPYGNDNYSEIMKKLIRTGKNIWYELNTNYFGMHEGGASTATDQDNKVKMLKLFKNKLIKELGPPRIRGEKISQRDKDVAKSTQIRFEEVALHCLNKIALEVPGPNLVLAGGCALNGVANARIFRETKYKNQYIQPAASDDGLCIGASYWVWHNVIKSEKRFHMNHAFWGPKYPEIRIKKLLKSIEYKFRIFEEMDELIEFTAKIISQGLVIGWYQGRSEFGPRALGNRSILANPTLPNMKEVINSKIKRRESFRPFAPSVLQEDVTEYFEDNITSPFMQHVVKIREKWRQRLPAITHIDGTGRLQTVTKETNFLYYMLIKKFKEFSGVGMLLNTSFNENEPIVDTPEQAYECFSRTDLDAIVLGKYIIIKPEYYEFLENN